MSQSKRLPETNYCKTLNVITTKLSIKMRFLDRLAVFAAEEVQALIDVGQIKCHIFNNHIQFCSVLSVACPWSAIKGALSSAHCRIWVVTNTEPHRPQARWDAPDLKERSPRNSWLGTSTADIFVRANGYITCTRMPHQARP